MQGIEKGVGFVSKGIAIGTEAASSLISKGASKLREKIEPNEKPTEIPESVQKGVHVAKKATGCVVGVSDFLMISLAKLTVAVGKQVKDAVADTEYVKSKEMNPHAKEAWKVTKSGVKGAAAVFGDLERGASALLTSVCHQTATTVEHKYGEQAGNVTAESLETGRSVAKLTYTYWSWKTWGIQFLGKVGEVIRRSDDKSSSSSPSTNNH
ncbi:Spartin [Geodia barretti]|uniref:Spartin n=2 Tax=Geodia barretti TaxID=519541 RepID=A0AA35SJG1_GEOBA|nr:Spartin [Geodia barretti]